MEYFLSGVDLRVVRGKACHLPLHAVSEAREHVGTTRQNNVPQVNIKLHYGAEEGVADAYSGKTHITGMTESLSAKKPLFADGDHLAVSKLAFLWQQ